MLNVQPTPKLELPTTPQEVADRQRVVGEQWATAYAEQPAGSAEIVLRNPAVYLNDVNTFQLPGEQQEKWGKLSDAADAAVRIAGTVEHTWSSSSTPLERLQSLVRDKEIDPNYRSIVADIMRVSSDLFAESVEIVPGNTNYYAGNVLGAESWLPKQK